MSDLRNTDAASRRLQRVTQEPQPRVTAARTVGWTLTGIGVFVASPFVVIPLMARMEEMTALPHVSSLAAWSLAWGALSAATIYVTTRAFFAEAVRVPAAAWLSLAGGVGLSAATTVALYYRVVAAFGYYDPDFAAMTSLLWIALLAVALGAFGVAIAPRGARVPAAVVVVAFAFVSLAIGISDATGAGDGIRPESWPLAVVMSLSMVYVAGVAVGALRAAAESPTVR